MREPMLLSLPEQIDDYLIRTRNNQKSQTNNKLQVLEKADLKTGKVMPHGPKCVILLDTGLYFLILIQEF